MAALYYWTKFPKWSWACKRKLLRVLQEREVERLGGRKVLNWMCVIATSNRDMLREIAAGKFREDLYFRLSVLPFTMGAPARAYRRYSATGPKHY